ncbi:hypothetical protein BDP27DRAFT_44227 [Rhodocollybia butyracea]|uniref:Uncharacterized protein n=1 Tax=Rhodocollybia butyracea TaxID=206335 RepID=A0A9P5Q688_9AGAR|nr:hypothetical protein BDP27DRAFT_44227 [Rhodocollybia butyracea]
MVSTSMTPLSGSESLLSKVTAVCWPTKLLYTFYYANVQAPKQRTHKISRANTFLALLTDAILINFLLAVSDSSNLSMNI